MNILVVRNDKLGDFMLAWPAFAIIKHYWPEAKLTALVPNYTAGVARLCPWLDEIVIDHQGKAGELTESFTQHHFDAMLTLFSSKRVAVAGWRAGIPYRLAPATKLFQFFYNRRLTQRRSRSQKPEYAYNIDLAYLLLSDFGKCELKQTKPDNHGDFLPTSLERPLLPQKPDNTREEFANIIGIDNRDDWIVIHPGSGGSANNLSASQYAQLATQLVGNRPRSFIITAGPNEEKHAENLAQMIRKSDLPAQVYSPDTIDGLIATLQWADLFISNSTGPLHIAAALNRPTAAFYPRHRSATPLRWQTLNAPDRRLAFTPPEGAEEEDVSSIDVTKAASRISEMMLGDRVDSDR